MYADMYVCTYSILVCMCRCWYVFMCVYAGMYLCVYASIYVYTVYYVYVCMLVNCMCMLIPCNY